MNWKLSDGRMWQSKCVWMCVLVCVSIYVRACPSVHVCLHVCVCVVYLVDTFANRN